MYWLLVGLVRSLQSPPKEALMKPLLCEDYSDLTSPTSNQIQYKVKAAYFDHFRLYSVVLYYRIIHKADSVVYDTF